LKQTLICAAVVLFATVTFAQSQRISADSPEEIIQQLWMNATAGELFTTDGIQRDSGAFAHPEDAAANKPQRVFSNSWAVRPAQIKGDNAEVIVDYQPIGELDSSLRFKPAPDDGCCMKKYGLVFHLARLPTYSIMYESDGKKLIPVKKKTTGDVAWQITDPRDFHWTTVNTAIRYVLEKRNKTTNPVIRANADRTITALLHYR